MEYTFKLKTMATKKQNVRSVKRKSYISQEVAEIMHKELQNTLGFMAKREETLTSRLNSIEKNGIPESTLEEIKREIRFLSVTIRSQTKAIEKLLEFFQASKVFIKQTTEKQ